jgi:hypothetical protein
MPSLVFDCHAITPFDFFSAVYFFKARRRFCLLRLYEFFRASCFMLILLVRQIKPAGCFADGSPAQQLRQYWAHVDKTLLWRLGLLQTRAVALSQFRVPGAEFRVNFRLRRDLDN